MSLSGCGGEGCDSSNSACSHAALWGSDSPSVSAPQPLVGVLSQSGYIVLDLEWTSHWTFALSSWELGEQGPSPLLAEEGWWWDEVSESMWGELENRCKKWPGELPAVFFLCQPTPSPLESFPFFYYFPVNQNLCWGRGGNGPCELLALRESSRFSPPEPRCPSQCSSFLTPCSQLRPVSRARVRAFRLALFVPSALSGNGFQL